MAYKLAASMRTLKWRIDFLTSQFVGTENESELTLKYDAIFYDAKITVKSLFAREYHYMMYCLHDFF